MFCSAFMSRIPNRPIDNMMSPLLRCFTYGYFEMVIRICTCVEAIQKPKARVHGEIWGVLEIEKCLATTGWRW
jgi:hypothetical protein